MTTGNWLNNDGLFLQYGVSKAIPELGSEFVMYGTTRCIDLLVNLGQFQYGTGAGGPQNPPLPTSFQGTYSSWTSAANAGILSYTTKMPLQATTPVSAPASGGLLTISNPQLVLEQVSVLILVPASAGTGGTAPTGITGIGLVTEGSTANTYVQVTPGSSNQILSTATNTQLAVSGATYIYLPDGTEIGTGSAPTVGTWMGGTTVGTLVPKCTNTNALGGTPPVSAYFSAICSAGQYIVGSGGAASGTPGGLFKVRINYNFIGTINE
jgi:hypothetical protein